MSLVLLQTEAKKNRIIFFGSTKMVHLSSRISYQITSFLVILELQKLLKTVLVWKLCAFLFLSVSLYGFSFFHFYHLPPQLPSILQTHNSLIFQYFESQSLHQERLLKNGEETFSFDFF